MSYNTRRNSANSNFNNGMGRGRPGLQQNFVPGGQYQQKPLRPGGPRPSGPRIQGPPPPPHQPQQAQQFPRQPPAAPLPPAPLKSALKKEIKNETNVGAPNPGSVGSNPQIGQQMQQQQAQQQQQQQNQPQTAQQQSAPQQNVPTQNVPTQNVPTPNVPTPNVPTQSVPTPNVPTPNVPTQSVPAQNVPTPQQNAVQENVPQQNVPQLNVQQNLQNMVPNPANIIAKQEMDVENGDTKKKTLVFKGKISKREKRGRRNRRLRKILVPKNALMVLNELVGGHKFTFLEKEPGQQQFYTEPETYIASVTIDGVEHLGYGKSKTAAKTTAAEIALRHIIMSKISAPLSASQSSTSLESDDVAMEVEGEKQEEEDVSWLHVASFAMHKLFSSWYLEADEKMEQTKALLRAGADLSAKLQDKQFQIPPKTRKPAKQLPQNPELLNPVMLLNQMRDDVNYEEYSKTGTPPHIMFVIKATVEGFDFYGKGTNKKVARKNCAYAACIKLYNLVYQPEEFDPNMCSEGVPLF